MSTKLIYFLLFSSHNMNIYVALLILQKRLQLMIFFLLYRLILSSIKYLKIVKTHFPRTQGVKLIALAKYVEDKAHNFLKSHMTSLD